MKPRAIDHIAKLGWEIAQQHGWAVVLVGAGDGLPGYAYTFGLEEKFGHREIVTSGLPTETMLDMLNSCGEVVRGGHKLVSGERLVGIILAGYPVEFREIDEEVRRRVAGVCRAHKGSDDNQLLQLVWPDATGKFPGEDGCVPAVTKLQDLRARLGLPT